MLTLHRLSTALVTALTALLMLTAAPAAHAAWPGQFSDVDEWPDWALQGQWFGDVYVSYGGDLAEAVYWELMIGDPPPDGNPRSKRWFRPNDTLTRAEWATILARTLGIAPANIGEPWYEPMVDALARRGIIPSHRSGNWDAAITRAELGHWVGRALRWYWGEDLPDRPELTFSDLNGVEGAEEILLATRFEVIKGYPDGTYRPQQTATRTEAAAMAVRLAKQLTKNPPDVEDFRRSFMEAGAATTALEKQAMETGRFDYALIERFDTEMAVYGPGGFADRIEEYFAGRPQDGFRETLSVTVTPILLRDTIALVKVQRTIQRTRKDGTAYPPISYLSYGYLTRQGDSWRGSNAKADDEYLPGQSPADAEGKAGEE